MRICKCIKLNDRDNKMVKNLNGFKNNPEDRYNNPKDIGFRFVL